MNIGRTGTPQTPPLSARHKIRALVPVASRQDDRDTGADDDRPPLRQPADAHRAAFIAHLLAMREGAPQTRQRRRAEPAEAIAAYSTVYRALSRAAPSAANRTVTA
ncbi:MAG TPA: hypothetical protein VNQ56_05905 [Pseudolabrys sp.]|nr:hypothetical protein [Pseudolabrys sp.]